MLKNCLPALLCICCTHTWAALPKQTSAFYSKTGRVAADVIQLNGGLEHGKVSIHWVTNADTAGGFFAVQKSTDGATWQEYQRLGANGGHRYRTTDEGTKAGNCWYRIALTDGAGNSSTSAPLWVAGAKKLISITVVRSAQSLQLLWWGPGAVTADVHLFSFNGQSAKNYGSISFTGSHTLPLTDLPPGRYILKFAAGPVVESLSFQY